ncbi:unnamed protein product [Mytilus coruscus]|uniref:PHD-type domain-containing protein n=1 Tax=Mytilus coruscus TaxID=42192 RepID=A0A6J8D3Z4_MYTCO|nr:unnamed protein product [Mytilus coruscus]
MLTRRHASASNIQHMPNPYSNAISSTAPIQKQYNLNKGKALQKKGENCNRQHIIAELKPGKNLVISLSTAAYELAKQIIPLILTSHMETFSTEERNAVDNKGVSVDKMYQVFNKKLDGSKGKQKKFTLCNEIKQKHHDLNIINNNILETLENLELKQKSSLHLHTLDNNETLENLELKQKSSLNLHTMDQNATNTSQELETLQIKQKISRNDHLVNNESIQESSLQSIDLCPMCQQPSHNDTIECSECSLWLHFSCAGISDKNLPTFRQNDFICHICSENLLYHKHQIDNEHDHQHNESLTIIKTLHNNSELNSTNTETDKIVIVPTATDQPIRKQTPEQEVQPIEHHEINEINTLNTATLNVEQRGIQQETKSKAKEEISLNKAHISQLETQIERLTYTVEILQKSQNLDRQQNNHCSEPPNIQQDQSPINSAQNQHLHNFCSQLIEQKLNEHRIRNLELPMLQNMQTMQAQYQQLMMQFQNHQHHQPCQPPKLPVPHQYHHSAYTQIPPPAVHQMYLPQNHQYVNTNLMYRQTPAYYRPTIPAQQRYHPTHVDQNTYVKQPT